MVTQEELMSRFKYNRFTGVFKWINPPKGKHWLAGEEAGYIHQGYRVLKIRSVPYMGHNMAWLYVHGRLPENLLDHKDGNPANNALSNLRPATHAQNMKNMRPRKGKVLPKGVRATRGKFQARITHERKSFHLGYFPTSELASKAYIKAAKKLHGEFARY